MLMFCCKMQKKIKAKLNELLQIQYDFNTVGAKQMKAVLQAVIGKYAKKRE